MSGSAFRNDPDFVDAIKKAVGLPLILAFAIFSHGPFVDALYDQPAGAVGWTVVLLLLFSNIYIVIGGYIASVMLAKGRGKVERIRHEIGGSRFQALSIYSFVWLIAYFIYELAI